MQLDRLALRRLDPFDFRAFGSSAQGDCSWEDFNLQLGKQDASATW